MVDSAANLKPGQPVRVVVVLQRLDAEGRVQLLSNIIGRPTVVLMDQAHLTAA
jgi:hypothetical protein